MNSTLDIRRLTRRTIIDMALRRQRPGTGSGLDFLMQRTTNVQMKFNASRTVDLGDITRMLGLANETDLASVRKLFQQYVPDDVQDLESLIRLGKLEMGGLRD